MDQTRDATRRPTILDVARLAGTSHATVSRYLNGRSYVARATADAIEDAIHRVGYVPNRTARSLVQQSTQAVAFVVRERPDLFFADPNLSRMAIGANAALSAAGYQMLLLIVDTDESADRIVTLVRGGFVDGALLVAMHEEDRVVAELAGAGVPLVTASTPLPDASVPWVDTDNEEASAAITRALVSTGRARVGEIHGPRDAPVSHQRHDGYVRALGAGFDPARVAVADEWSLGAGARAMEELLAAASDLDGVVAASDVLAAGAMDTLHRHGRRVPDDVGVVGFDDSPWATQTSPALTTVHQDAQETGRRMAVRLVEHLRGGAPLEGGEVVPSRVVWRGSAGPRPGA